jgi:hypothetical protein
VTTTSQKVNGIAPTEPPPDAAVLGDEVALLADEVSGLVLGHPRGLAFTSRLVIIRNMLAALLQEVRQMAPTSPPEKSTKPAPWPRGPLDPPGHRRNGSARKRPRTLSASEVTMIRTEVAAGLPRYEAARRHGVSHALVTDITRGVGGNGVTPSH